MHSEGNPSRSSLWIMHSELRDGSFPPNKKKSWHSSPPPVYTRHIYSAFSMRRRPGRRIRRNARCSTRDRPEGVSAKTRAKWKYGTRGDRNRNERRRYPRERNARRSSYERGNQHSPADHSYVRPYKRDAAPTHCRFVASGCDVIETSLGGVSWRGPLVGGRVRTWE